MTRPARALAALLVAAAASACSAIVDVDDYRVDADPCPASPTSCEGGASYAYVVWVADAPRADPTTGTLLGFDLDATDEAVCRQEDHVSPDGERGIDNALAPLVSLFEAATMIDIRESTIDSILAGTNLTVVHLDGVDDLANDDCIQLANRRGFVPEGVILDADGDRQVDQGIRLDYGREETFDDTACIIDGTLHARYPDMSSALPFLTIELDSRRLRANGRVSEDAIEEGVNGGSFDVEQFIEGLNAGLEGGGDVGPLIRPAADLDPVDGTCRSLSWGLSYEAVRIELGEFQTRM